MLCEHHNSGRVLASTVEIDDKCVCGERTDQDKTRSRQPEGESHRAGARTCTDSRDTHGTKTWEADFPRFLPWSRRADKEFLTRPPPMVSQLPFRGQVSATASSFVDRSTHMVQRLNTTIGRRKRV